MKILDFLDKESVFAELKGANKSDVLMELVRPLHKKWPSLDPERVHEVLLEREQLGSTGIGDGIAIPHGKLEGVDDVCLVVGRSAAGVDFESLDHQPAHIFFLVLAPENVAGKHLRILARISRLLQDQSFRDSFMQAAGNDELWALLQHA
ncbi:MAG TPA: PTS sugar transporter subunit IIA [Desulfomicrobiaceae bacterium]|nr:PTS sugar transporter subunit IIA [Desulfomicrobiaceae bacterium]